MSFFDLTALSNRILQQVSNGANRAGTWTRGQVLNIRRKRPKSATTTTTATTSTTITSADTQKTNGESSKRQSKQSTSAMHKFIFSRFCFLPFNISIYICLPLIRPYHNQSGVCTCVCFEFTIAIAIIAFRKIKGKKRTHSFIFLIKNTISANGAHLLTMTIQMHSHASH